MDFLERVRRSRHEKRSRGGEIFTFFFLLSLKKKKKKKKIKKKKVEGDGSLGIYSRTNGGIDPRVSLTQAVGGIRLVLLFYYW